MNNFDLIERYLLDQMTTDEKVAFEERMNNEPDLRAEKDAIAELILGVESLGLKNKLKGRRIGEGKDSNVVTMKPKSTFSFRRLAVAASIAALFFCGWWFLQPNFTGEDQLFAQAFVTDPGLATPMSETDNYNFYDAMVEYKMENYDKAIEVWTSVSSDIGKDTVDYYLGMAYLNKNEYDAAAKKLKSIDSNSPLSQKANWYLLSILIKEKKYTEAKEALKAVNPSTHPMYDEISKYLEKK